MSTFRHSLSKMCPNKYSSTFISFEFRSLYARAPYKRVYRLFLQVAQLLAPPGDPNKSHKILKIINENDVIFLTINTYFFNPFIVVSTNLYSSITTWC